MKKTSIIFVVLIGLAFSGLRSGAAAEEQGELLYNGIRLPAIWPPRDIPYDRKVRPVPYLNNIPDVLPIDVGRQLFVDDFLIDSTTMTRRFHYPVKYPENPILKPETPLELNNGNMTCATLFNDAALYDPREKIYKMWYHAGWFDGTGYALSSDGLRWTRKELDVESGTNRVLPKSERRRDGCSVFLDHDTKDPSQRFKMFLYERPDDQFGGQIYTSPDGIHWKFQTRTLPVGDNTTIFYNPFRKKWVYSIRTWHREMGGRDRSYRECDDLVQGATWKIPEERVFWAGADELDLPDPFVTSMRPSEEELKKGAAESDNPEKYLQIHAVDKYGDPTQLYNLDAAPYESLMIGVYSIHYGPDNWISEMKKMPKTTELQLAYSRDGFHWDRPDRTPFIPATRKKGDWDFNYIHCATTVCTVFADKIYFYYGAFSGESPNLGSHIYSGGATGVAILRRDGFASMSSGGETGVLTTRPVVFKGAFPFVNVDAGKGELLVEILDENGKTVPGFEKDWFVPIKIDTVKHPLEWKGTTDLSVLSGKKVRFRFFITQGDLYAFWVSPDVSGTSQGFVAAGSSDYPGPKDE